MRLDGKRVLVTLPLTDSQRGEFARIVEGAGGSATFIREMQIVDSDTEGVAVIVGNVPASTIHAPEELEWLQTSSAGYDHYLVEGRLAAGTILTNATGAYGQAVSEHMFAQLLCLMKKLHLYRDNQQKSVWKDEGSVTTLVDARVLVLGAGDIGTHFAELCKAMGAHVFGIRRKMIPLPANAPFEHMDPIEALGDLLPQSDVVACVMPSSPQTRGLANADFFARMRPGSYFVNAGRGDLVVASDLCLSLAMGHLAGAALDVTDPEPLPADHPLWKQPNALITPHVAGFWHLQQTTDNVISICRDNLCAYIAGTPLRNRVAR